MEYENQEGNITALKQNTPEHLTEIFSGENNTYYKPGFDKTSGTPYKLKRRNNVEAITVART